jgi:hypothetical protein
MALDPDLFEKSLEDIPIQICGGKVKGKRKRKEGQFL